MRIPAPSPAAAVLFQALKIRLPDALPHNDIPVAKRKKLSASSKPRSETADCRRGTYSASGVNIRFVIAFTSRVRRSY